jgi:signal transduction histidine kinase
MVRCPLNLVMGSSFRRFLSTKDRAMLGSLLRHSGKAGFKMQMTLHAGDGSEMPVQISIRPTATHGDDRATLSMVVTDLTEARRTEELLRALTHRVVKVQEDERGRVALELHDGITQLLCAVVFRSQALVASLSAHEGPARSESRKLRDLAGRTAKELERVSHDLRPSVLDRLGLVAALCDASTEFAKRTAVSVKLACKKLTGRLTADGRLTLYRILQEALRNVEKHAHAHNVYVGLTESGGFVQLEVKDDGVGFDPEQRPDRRKRKGGLGLLGMKERAAYAGGSLEVKSVSLAGTRIEVRIPLLPKTKG